MTAHYDPSMARRCRAGVAILVLACLFVGMARADHSKRWDFTISANYDVSDPVGIEVADGAAKLKLQANRRYDASVDTYFTNGTERVGIEIGTDVSLVRSAPYGSPGIFTSRVLDGGAVQLWGRLHAKAQTKHGLNAAGEMVTNMPGLVSLLHFNGNYMDEVSGVPATAGPGALISPAARLGSGAASFAGGTNDFVRLVQTNLLDGATEYSICLWISLRRHKTPAAYVGERGAFINGLAASPSNPDQLALYVNGGIMEGNASVPLDEWVFVAGTWRSAGGRGRLYLNGQLDEEGTVGSGVTLSQTDHIQISGIDSPSRVDGAIDEVAIFDRELTPDEVMDLYLRPRSALFQVRSAPDPSALGTRSFVGPDGTPSTYYTADFEALTSLGDFKIWERYAQYRAYLYGPAYCSGSDPRLDAVGLVGSFHDVFDNTAVDFAAGVFDGSVGISPVAYETPYLSLARTGNGGMCQAGMYESPVVDGGGPRLWYRLFWTVPEELDGLADSSMLGLYHMNSSFTDSTPNGFHGTPFGVSYTHLAKLGPASAVFDGNSYVRVGGSIAANPIKTIEFWLKNDNLDDGLLQFSNDSTNRIYMTLQGGMVTARGVPGAAYTIYVNGASSSRRLLPGWNHVALVSEMFIPVRDFEIGRANGDGMQGLMDEMAYYSRVLDEAEIKEHFVAGRRTSAGRARLQVRSGDVLPLTTTFVGDNGTASDWFEVSRHGGAQIHPSIFNKRYFQYRISFEGDGGSSPAVGPVRVEDPTEAVLFEHSSVADVDAGDFDGGKVKWVGDEIRLCDLSTAPGLINLDPVAPGLVGLWHMDEEEWPAGPSVVDSAGGNNGSSQGGAQPSYFPRVGARCGEFDGVDDQVNIPPIVLGGDFSISAWFKSSDTRRSAVVSRSDGGFILEFNGDGNGTATGRVAFVVDSGGNKRIALSSVARLNDGVWHHVAGVRNGDHIYVYVDGVPSGSKSLGAGYGAIGISGMLVAAHPGANTLEGFVDEVALHTRALSDSEILDSMAVGSGGGSSGTYVSRVLDAGKPAIWESVDWNEAAPYGKGLFPIDADLVALWHADETGGLLVADSSGWRHEGFIVHSVTWGTGRIHGGLVFDGSGGYVLIPDAPTLEGSNISVEAWVLMNAVGERVILDRRSGGSGYALGVDADGKPHFDIAGTVCKGDAGIQAGQWYHVAGTYDGEIMRLYLNGLGVAACDLSSGDTDGGEGRIGLAVAGGTGLDGRIDEVAIFTRRLLPEEIMDRFRAGSARIGLQVRAGPDESFAGVDFTGPDGTTNTYFNVPGESMVGTVPLGRYFQCRVVLSSDHAIAGPRFQGMVVNQGGYPTNCSWVTPADGQGMPFAGKVLAFEHSMAANVDASVRYQVSGDNGTNWFYWGGDEWSAVPVASNLWPHANEWDAVNDHIHSFYDELYAKVGGVFKFKSLLLSPDDRQVALDWVNLTVSEGAVVVESPNGEEVGEKAWVTGVPYDITWSSIGTVSDNLAIELYDQSGSRKVATLGTGLPNTGSYTTIIGGNPRSDYRILIRDLDDPTVEDWSDGDFQLTANLRLTAPNGGEFWYASQANRITWESPGPAWLHLGSLLWLWFSPDGGTNWGSPIAQITTNQIGRNAFEWLTPSNQARFISETARMAVSTPTPNPLSPITYRVDFSNGIFTNAGIVITYPAAGAGVKMGVPVDVEWTAAGAGDGGCTIELFDGTTWSNVTSEAPCGAGTNSFSVRLSAANATHGAWLRITANDDPLVRGLSGPFTLADINIIAPRGGTIVDRDRWQIDTTHTVQWTSAGAGDTVDVEYSTDSAHEHWLPIAMDYANVDNGVHTNQSPPWNILGPPCSEVVVRVRSVEQPGFFVLTEPFSVSGVQVVEPNGGEQWEFAGTNTIRWLHQDAGAGIRIDIAYEHNPSSNDFETVVPNWFIFGESYQVLPGAFRRPSNFARIRLTAVAPPDAELLPMFDVSDDCFQIKGMSVEHPANGAVYPLGTTVPQGLQWYSAGADDSSAEVYYSSDGVTYDSEPLKIVLNSDDGPGPGLNRQNFEVPRTLVPSSNARLKLVAGPYEAVSEPFTVQGIRFTRPVAGQTLDVGARDRTVTWTAGGLSPAAYATCSLSVNGMAGPYHNADLPTNTFVAGLALLWSIPESVAPTTNAVIRMRVTSPAADTNIVAYSDPFTLRGIKVTAPAAGASWAHTTTQTVAYLAAGMGPGARANLYYSPDGVAFDFDNPIAINDDIDEGAVNSIAWGIEATSELTRMPSTNAHVMVTCGAYSNVSAALTLNGIKVTSPVGSDTWCFLDVTNTIRWASVGAVDNYTISFTQWEDGAPVHSEQIAAGVSGNSYVWTMPSNSVDGQVTIQVTDGTFTGISEMFEAVLRPAIRIIDPKPGDFWKVGTTNTIRWSKGGSMDNAFVVSYSTEPYALTNELGRGAFDFADGVYSCDWVIPILLGPTRIIVTNQTDALVKDTLDDFEIAAKFDIEPFTHDLYARKLYPARWVTRGDVESVDLYYSTDSDRAPASWVKINTEGPFSDAIGHNLWAVFAWTLPDVKSDTVWLRVQDHDFPTERFDASVPGPFDDLGPFSVNYYRVVWEVYDAVASNALDSLSVTDTSGWSASGLASPIVHEYPFGTWNTTWYCQYFRDSTVSNWFSDANKTNVVYLQRSELGPDDCYVSPSGGHIWPYLDWTSAATSILDAVEAVSDVGTVHVTNGTYHLRTQISLTSGVTVLSANGPRYTTVDGGMSNRCFYLDALGCVVDGFTITNGYTTGYGGGVYCRAGTVRDCVISGNTGFDGGGAYLEPGAVIRECEIVGNRASWDGGGLFCHDGAVARNCTVHGNSAHWHGGGMVVRGGLVQNCTVADNAADHTGGGVYCSHAGTVRNTIMYFNVATNAGSNWDHIGSASYSHCCTFPDPGGAANTTNTPGFNDRPAGDYHLSGGSACIDTGTAVGAPDVDLDGVPRPLDGNADGTNAYDIGAYEFAHGGIDSDGDGMTDRAEVDASTDPLSRESVLGMTGVGLVGDGIRLEWQGGTKVRQYLECRDSLTSPGSQWTVIHTKHPPTPVTNSLLHVTPTNQVLYYRVRTAR